MKSNSRHRQNWPAFWPAIVSRIIISSFGSPVGFQKQFVFQACSRNTKISTENIAGSLLPSSKGTYSHQQSHSTGRSVIIVFHYNFSRFKVMLLKNKSNFSNYFTKTTAIGVAIPLQKSSRGVIFFIFFFCHCQLNHEKQESGNCLELV